MHVQQRLGLMAVEPRHDAGAAHAMPLVAQPAGDEVQRIAAAG